MSQTQEQYDKLWKMLDDCIKTKKFKQLQTFFADEKCGRCINGVFLSYMGWDGKIFGDGSLYEVKKLPAYQKLEKMFRGGLVYSVFGRDPPKTEENFKELKAVWDKMNENDIVYHFEHLYQKFGIVDLRDLAILNNKGWSFELLRDLLKKMDV